MGRDLGGAGPVLAGDIGGTHTRLGIAVPGQPVPSGQSGQSGQASPQIAFYRDYVNAEFSGLPDIIRTFLAGAGRPPLTGVSLASAGYILDGELRAVNLPWPVILADLRHAVGVEQVEVVNDAAAAAYGTRYMGGADTLLLNANEPHPYGGTVAVLGPGTGLGAAVLVTTGSQPVVLPTEAGQMALAPANEREDTILKVLRGAGQHVPVEAVLSGRGLVTLYSVLGRIEGGVTPLSTPKQITDAALDGGDALAERALHCFCDMLGSVAGDLALAYGARAGLYLTGGILPQIRHFLTDSRFMERFVGKGEMAAFLGRIPVRLVLNGQIGVLGAAGWFWSERSQIPLEGNAPLSISPKPD